MPATPMKNLLYRAALPLFVPSVKGKYRLEASGHPIHAVGKLERLLCKHRALHASILLSDGDDTALLHAPVVSGAYAAQLSDKPIYRVASITKTATALVTLRLCEAGLISLESGVGEILPEGPGTEALRGVTVRQLLCHTSGLRDTSAYETALDRQDTFHSVITAPGVVAAKPGASFAYSNLGYGLLGCVIEQATRQPLALAFDELLFNPLGMHATLDASTLNEADVVPITRMLSRRKQPPVTITALGRLPLTQADPLRHFGHTAGAMYTDVPSLQRMLTLIAQEGTWNGQQLLQAESIREMTRPHASYGKLSPTMQYGLGLILIDDPAISQRRIIGHQGFAYGCVDGAFLECGTGRMVVSLNGGASEARIGRIGCINQDMMRFAFREELPLWK